MPEAVLAEFGRTQGSRWQTLTRIHPSSPKVSRVSDLWSDRYLLWMFTWRDIKVRYKQTFLGAGWALLQPLLTTLVFTVVFSRVAKVSTDGDPYPVFVLCGLLPWQFFASGLIRSSSSLVESRYLLTKVSIPRLIAPVSAVLSGAPDFAVSLATLLGVMGYYRLLPSPGILLVFPLMFVVAMASLSIGLLLSAVNVRYRDVGYVIPFFTQLLFFLTPIAYPISLVPRQWRTLYTLNPMTAVVEAFRYAILRDSAVDWRTMIIATVTVGMLLLVGLLYFQRTEKSFADVV